MPPTTQVASSPAFDIVAKYRALTTADPSLTPPIAAIESLIALLTSSPATTVSETLDLLQQSSTTLRNALPSATSIPLSAGTDLFQRYLVATLQRPGALGPGGDFSLLRQHLISNSRLFVARAKEARTKIATHALPFIQHSTAFTVVTHGPSRVVSALLTHAAEQGRLFSVIHITPSPCTSSTSAQVAAQVAKLRALAIPVATIPTHAAAYALSTPATRHCAVVVGGSAVLENGGLLAPLGTYQLALLAKARNKPFYVAAESYKFVRMYPLGQAELGQDVLKFECEGEGEEESKKKKPGGTKKDGKEGREQEEFIDVTPPDLISALITETGVMTPSAVSEELIKLWF